MLDKAQQNYLENGDPAVIGQIATALTTLQAVTQIELTDEEKAELRDLHAEAMKQSYK